jgi:hypothetical protein
VLGGVSVARWALRLFRPVGQLVTTSQFAHVVSIMTIKQRMALASPTQSFIIVIVLS